MKRLLALSLLAAVAPEMAVAQRPEPAAVHRSVDRAGQQPKPVDLRHAIPELSDTTRGRPWTTRGAWTWVGVGAAAGLVVGAAAGAIALRNQETDDIVIPPLIIVPRVAIGLAGGSLLGLLSYGSTRTGDTPSRRPDHRDQPK